MADELEKPLTEELKVANTVRHFAEIDLKTEIRKQHAELLRELVSSEDRSALEEHVREAWKIAALRRGEARRYYVAWQVARMRAASYRRTLYSRSKIG